MKLGILVAYKFLTKIINFGVTQCISGFVCLSVCLFVAVSVCLTFFSAMLKHRNFNFGQLPRYGQPPKPIEFEVDQAMVIRLISLMSKLLRANILNEYGTRYAYSYY